MPGKKNAKNGVGIVHYALNIWQRYKIIKLARKLLLLIIKYLQTNNVKIQYYVLQGTEKYT